LRRKV